MVTPDKVVAFPNPCRLGTAAGVMKFDYVPPDGEVRIFTVSGELVRRLAGSGGRVIWDGRNRSGDDVVPGIYLYAVSKPGGKRDLGKIFVVK